MNHFNRRVVFIGIFALIITALFMLHGYKNIVNPTFRNSSIEKEQPIELQKAKENKFIFVEKQPVFTIYGRVDHLVGSTIGLTMTVVTPSSYNQSNESNYIEFTIRTNKNTLISRDLSNITLLYKTPKDFSLPVFHFSDIKIGSYLTAYSDTDLRTLNSPEFTASRLELPAMRNIIEGHISNIEGDIITVERSPFAAPWNQGENRMHHLVTLNNQTEISSQNALLQKSDLKTGMQVRVYAMQDVEETDQLTALRVEPFTTTVEVSPAPVVTPK